MLKASTLTWTIYTAVISNLPLTSAKAALLSSALLFRNLFTCMNNQPTGRDEKTATHPKASPNTIISVTHSTIHAMWFMAFSPTLSQSALQCVLN